MKLPVSAGRKGSKGRWRWRGSVSGNKAGRGGKGGGGEAEGTGTVRRGGGYMNKRSDDQ